MFFFVNSNRFWWNKAVWFTLKIAHATSSLGAFDLTWCSRHSCPSFYRRRRVRRHGSTGGRRPTPTATSSCQRWAPSRRRGAVPRRPSGRPPSDTTGHRVSKNKPQRAGPSGGSSLPSAVASSRHRWTGIQSFPRIRKQRCTCISLLLNKRN